MSARHAQTARRWAYSAWFGVTALCVAVFVGSAYQVGAYHKRGDDVPGGYMFAIVLVVLGLPLVQLAWLVRFYAWWRAARAPGRPYWATLVSAHRGAVTATPWLLLVDAHGQEVWGQRVMWEPWLSDWHDPVDVEVTIRRVGRRGGREGPAVVDIPGGGRLWPAGRARVRPPRLEPLEAASFVGAPKRRWPVLLALSATLTAVGALRFVAEDPVAGLLAGVMCGGLGVSAWLFFGGPPFYRV